MLGKQPREFHCSRVFGNPGKALALVYEILHNLRKRRKLDVPRTKTQRFFTISSNNIAQHQQKLTNHYERAYPRPNTEILGALCR